MKTKTQVTTPVEEREDYVPVNTEKKKRSSEAMSPEVAIDKCDIMGSNLVTVLVQAGKQRAQIIKDNREAVTDFIFGRSEENPLAAITAAVKEKEEMYNERVDSLVESVNRTKLKRKINQ